VLTAKKATNWRNKCGFKTKALRTIQLRKPKCMVRPFANDSGLQKSNQQFWFLCTASHQKKTSWKYEKDMRQNINQLLFAVFFLLRKVWQSKNPQIWIFIPAAKTSWHKTLTFRCEHITVSVEQVLIQFYCYQTIEQFINQLNKHTN